MARHNLVILKRRYKGGYRSELSAEAISPAMKGSLQFVQNFEYFVGFRESAQLFLGKNQNAVDNDFEHAAAAFDQLGLNAVFLFDLGGQPGRLR